MKYINLFLLTLLVFSCTNNRKDEKYKTETINLNSYLHKYLSKEIPKDSTVFILVSDFGCSGCIERIVNKFSSKSNFIFILTNGSYNKYIKFFNPISKFWIDSSETINHLSYHNGNVGIIMTHSQYIDTLVSIVPATLNEQIKFLK